ncbi:Dolichol-phosphate mannosyltransferase subunit 3 [Cynara cardunculus var. scolymus]|uniref:Dolichol-phosphate mannosyltransferase subunit 3 n=1 Tax=Cynara cardunculus var. scolymus TaxID=59895 RepID=A0A118K246_CYNCS|nr:Dolichol-phosphate mannosyltransferase subunit 3 [Cynara cardunculus var. scolymus]
MVIWGNRFIRPDDVCDDLIIGGCNFISYYIIASVNCELPLYLVVSLGCYGLFMVGFGLMQFPTCPQEAVLLQQDVIEVKQFLKRKGVDVGSD